METLTDNTATTDGANVIGARIAEGRMVAFEANFSRIAKKLAKAGFFPTMETRQVDEVRKRETVFGVQEYVYTYFQVSISGFPSLRKDGFALVGVREYIANGEWLNKSVPDTCGIDMSQVANFGACCHHCNAVRQRNKVCVLVNSEGKQIQVGSTCVAEYFGLPCAEELVSWYADELCADQDEWSSTEGTRTPKATSFAHALRVATDLVCRFGFSPSSAGEYSTRHDLSVWLFGDRDAQQKLHTSKIAPKKSALSQAEIDDKVRQILEWLPQQNGEFMANLQILQRAQIARAKDLGYIAALPGSFDKDMARRAELDAKKASWASKAGSQHQGQIGEKLTVAIRVDRENVVDNEYGYGRASRTYIYGMSDDNGNQYVWFSSNGLLTLGEKFTIVGTVKAHDQYKGVNQTVLTRCKIALNSEADEAALKKQVAKTKKTLAPGVYLLPRKLGCQILAFPASAGSPLRCEHIMNNVGNYESVCSAFGLHSEQDHAEFRANYYDPNSGYAIFEKKAKA